MALLETAGTCAQGVVLDDHVPAVLAAFIYILLQLSLHRPVSHEAPGGGNRFGGIHNSTGEKGFWKHISALQLSAFAPCQWKQSFYAICRSLATDLVLYSVRAMCILRSQVHLQLLISQSRLITSTLLLHCAV